MENTMLKEQEEKDNVVDLNAHRPPRTKGKPPTYDNWLAKLDHGCLFLTKHRESPLVLVNEFTVVRHLPRHTLLLNSLNDEEGSYMWVNTFEFSQSFQLEAVIREKEE